MKVPTEDAVRHPMDKRADFRSAILCGFGFIGKKKEGGLVFCAVHEFHSQFCFHLPGFLGLGDSEIYFVLSEHPQEQLPLHMANLRLLYCR